MSVFLRHQRAAFAAGLLLRLVLLVGVPVTYSEWFLPIIVHAATAGTIDPWTSFLAAGGPAVAFPYGPIYLAVFAPLTALFSLISPRAAAAGLGLTVLALDLGLFAVLRRFVQKSRAWLVTYAYWLSPIVIYVCYWHGQLDVLPVLILSVSLLLLSRQRFKSAGLMLGLATAAKLSMAIAIPFVWMYVAAARRLRNRAAHLVLATLFGAATLAPFLVSPAFRQMVLGTPEREKAFSLAMSLGGDHVYIMPLVLAALVLTAWRLRRLNFNVLFCLIGVAFFVLFLLTPASPGWALWLMPFLVVHLSRVGSTGWMAAAAFSGLFVLFQLLTSTGAVLPFGGGTALSAPAHVRNMLLSLSFASGGMVAFQMLQYGLLRDPFFRTTREPLAIGVAGDSGAGKDTLAAALTGLFGANATALISGDDYHSWDRHKPMWRALTHLNPAANDLRRFSNHIVSLKSGYPIEVPHYDHVTGRMTKPRRVEPTDVIIGSGLHALYTPELLAAFDLRIFLDMDDKLRTFLKLRRDVQDRRHSPDAVLASLRKRQSDSERYIRPQAEAADLILSLAPLDPRDIADPLGGGRAVRMGLRVSTQSAGPLEGVTRLLIGVMGMQVTPCDAYPQRAAIEVIGEPSAQDVATASRVLLPMMADYLAIEPQWSGGTLGLMQLVVLDQLNQRLVLGRGS